MSHDLYFQARPGTPEPEPHALATYFLGRKHYSVSEGRATYDNEDTGVLFSFEFGGETSQDEHDPPHTIVCSFSINYCRPSFFCLEAAPEIRAFVDAFGFIVDDPQGSSGSLGQFSESGFRGGWDEGNRLCATTPGLTSHPYSLPKDDLVKIWNWNRGRSALQQRSGDGQFVPKICLMDVGGRAKSMVVWADAIPALLPRVDYALVPLQQIKPWFERGTPIRRVPFAEIERHVRSSERRGLPLDCLDLQYQTPPKELVRLIRKSVKIKGGLVLPPWHTVLDHEVLQSHAGGT